MHVLIHLIYFIFTLNWSYRVCNGNMILYKLSFLNGSCGTVRINSEHQLKVLKCYLEIMQWKEFTKQSLLAF